MNHHLSITFGRTDESSIFSSFYKLNRLCLYHKAIFIFPPSFQESYPKKRNYTMEIVPSASLDTFPSENENFLCDLTDTAVTKKPCSLEIARAPSPRTGNVSYSQFDLHADIWTDILLIFCFSTIFSKLKFPSIVVIMFWFVYFCILHFERSADKLENFDMKSRLLARVLMGMVLPW